MILGQLRMGASQAKNAPLFITVIIITITNIILSIIIATVTQPVLANRRCMQNMRSALPRASVDCGTVDPAHHSSRNHNLTDLSR